MEFLEGVLLKQVSKDFKSGALTLSDPAFFDKPQPGEEANHLPT